MSIPLLTGALIDGILVTVLGLWIRSRYRLALTSVEEKSAGLLFYYRNGISMLFHRRFSLESFSCFIQYAALHLLVLGLGFAVLTFLVKGPVGYFAGILSGWLRSHPGVLKWVDRVSGTMLIGLGVRLALTHQR